MYWTDLEESKPRVERCHLDGTGCIHILSNRSIQKPATITVDPLSAWVYFVDAEGEHDEVFRYNGLTGQHNTFTLIGKPLPVGDAPPHPPGSHCNDYKLQLSSLWSGL